jgi:hypothetical protein
MVEFIGVKRPATHAGEIGIFPAAEMFAEDMSAIPNGVEATVVITIKATLKYNRASWFLANLVAQSCDWLDDKDDARESLLIEAKHYRKYYDKLRDRVELRAKPTRTLDATAWIALLRRMVDRANTVFVPNDPDSPFRQELNRFMSPLFERDGPPLDDVPPPTAIPDGPGHNSGPAGVGGFDMPWCDRCQSYHLATADHIRPAAAAHAASEIDRPKPPAGPEATQRPRQRPEPTTPAEPAGPPREPKVAGEYPAYAKWHLDLAANHGEAMGWLWTPAQAKLRDQLLIPIGVRKQLERYCADKFGGSP